MLRHFDDPHSHRNIELKRRISVDDGENPGGPRKFVESFAARYCTQGKNVLDPLLTLTGHIGNLVSKGQHRQRSVQMPEANFAIERLNRPPIHVHRVKELGELQQFVEISHAAGASTSHQVRAVGRAHDGGGGYLSSLQPDRPLGTTWQQLETGWHRIETCLDDLPSNPDRT